MSRHLEDYIPNLSEVTDKVVDNECEDLQLKYLSSLLHKVSDKHMISVSSLIHRLLSSDYDKCLIITTDGSSISLIGDMPRDCKVVVEGSNH